MENPKEWPRVHTCLNNWCPEQRDECWRCDKVLEILTRLKEKVDEDLRVQDHRSL